MKLVFIVLILLTQIAYSTTFETNKLPSLEFDTDYLSYLKYQEQLNNTFRTKIQPSPLKVVVENIVNFPSGSQRRKLEEAFIIMKEVLNSAEFRNYVYSYIATTTGKREYTGNNNLTNEEVYASLMLGKELTLPATIGEANLYIKKYHRRFSKVIGWTNPNSSRWINVNWRFYKKYSTEEMVSNLVHEWIHLLGYFHVRVGDYDSVPYAIGRIAYKVAIELKQKKNLIAQNYPN